MAKREDKSIIDEEDETPRRRRRANPLVRWVGRRLSCALFLIIFIVVGGGACAFFAPAAFQQTIRIAQSAGLKVYTLVLSVSGNAALKISIYESVVTAQTEVNRDTGLLSVLYGESAKIEGTMRVSLGADLMNNKYGVLNCDVDDRTVRIAESRAPLAQFAFDRSAIRQEAFVAFKNEGARQAIVQFWPEARKRLQAQVTSWALGVEIPEVPTLTECPAQLSGTPAPSATVTPR